MNETILRRRAVFAALWLVSCVGLAWVAWRPLAADGVNGLEALILLCVAGITPWAALATSNAGLGLVLLLRPAAPPPAPAGPPRLNTALVCCVRSEDMAQVLPPLGMLLDALPEGRFVLWVLSDTQDPEAARAEEAAVARFAAARAPGRVRYRRRAENTGFKAGNVMDFLDHHAEGLDLFLTLDADSVMTPRAVLRLVAEMEADPRLGILQQLIVGRPATAAFPRIFQFGMRAGMRAWATGQAWWQGDEGPYWGHNAILRIAPFRAHARLETLPDGSRILSHDMVESVRLQAAGWKVRLLPEEEGSLEANPPAVPEFLARDERWGAGNMQYRHLLRLPDLTAMGRLQLVQAILLFLSAPLYALILVLGVLNAATGGGAGTPMGALALALACHWLAIYAPKLAGYAQLLARPALAARYGGRGNVLRGAALEVAFIHLFDSVSTVNKALFLARLALGRRGGWAPQNRADRGVAWADAARLLWPHTALGVVLTAALATVSLPALLAGLPFTLGLLLAVPLCVFSADPRLSAWLRARRIAATPEELAEGFTASPAR